MVKLKSKGQGAMEYLMNYAWAILIVLVVGVVLYQMGVFNQGQGSVITTGFPQLRPVPQTVSYLQSGTFQAALLNTMGTAVMVTNIGLEEKNTALGVCTITSPLNVSVKAGDALTVTATCPTKQSKEPYNIYLNVSYNIAMETTTARFEEGTIQGQIE